MEVFTTQPYRERKGHGRPSVHTVEARLMIGRTVSNRELTYSKASEVYGVSEGAIGAYVKLFNEHSSGKKRTDLRAKRDETVVEFQHQSQVKELKQEIAELYLENQMLKKMLAHFRQPKKEAGSVITSENLAESQEVAE